MTARLVVIYALVLDNVPTLSRDPMGESTQRCHAPFRPPYTVWSFAALASPRTLDCSVASWMMHWD